MDELLQKLFFNILSKLADAGTDQLTTKLNDYLALTQLKKVDEETRAYLAQHLQPDDYETIDGYFAKQGLYASDSLKYTDLSQKMIQEAIDDFCDKNPNKATTIREIEPTLRQALVRSFEVLFEHVTPGERAIIHQNELQAKSSEKNLAKICSLLSQATAAHQFLLPEQVDHFCQEVNDAIDAGAVSAAKSCLELMDKQVDSKERYRWTFCRIRLDRFLYGSGNRYHFCDRFLEEAPDQETVEALVTFLISTDDFVSLSIISPLIQSTSKTGVLNLVLTQDIESFLNTFFDSEMHLKSEYLQNEWVLWGLGNLNLTRGDGYAALSCYQALETFRCRSLWLRWKKCCARFLNAHFSLCFHSERADLSEIHSIMQEFLELSSFFMKTGDDLLSRYIDLLFTCAAALQNQTESPWDILSTRAKLLPIAQKYRYQEQMTTWKNIDDQALRRFCQEESYDDLWANYLIQRSHEDGHFVISELDCHPELFQKTFLYTIAYAYALNTVYGIEAALNAVKDLILPHRDELSKAIFLAQMSARFQSPQATCLLNQAFEAAVPMLGDRIYPGDIRTLIRLLLDAKRDQDALTVSERYRSISPAIGKVCLDLMLRQEGMESDSNKLLDELSVHLPDDPFLLYCRGFLREKEHPGTGYDYFQKSFDKSPDLNNATALLAARLNRLNAKKDQVLEFCERQDDPHAQYLCGRSYLQMGSREQGLRCLLRGLLLCGSSVHDDLFLSYILNQLSSSGHELPPEMITSDTAIILKNQADGTIRKLWLHDDASLIPVGGSDFAGYEHISVTAPSAVMLYHMHKGDTVQLDDGQTYSVVAINYGTAVAVQYCAACLTKRGQIITGTISDDDPAESIAELLSQVDSSKEARKQIKDLYINPTPGLTLNILQSCIGQPYYEAIHAIFLDRSIPFWAGGEHSKLHGDCLLTGSSLAVLGSLGLYPPKISSTEFTFWITPMTLREVIGEITHFQQSPSPAGTLGTDSDGQVFFIENTEEFKSMRRAFYACIRSWCDYAKKTEEIAPENYPEELKKVQKAFHTSEIEAATLAGSASYVILSDDLLFRQYLHANNIPNAATTEVLAEIAPDASNLLRAMKTLCSCNYHSSATEGLIKKLSQFFDATADEFSLADIAEQSIPLVKQYINAPESRDEFLSAVQRSIQNDYQFHVTLLWIIEQSLQLFTVTHPELNSSQSDHLTSSKDT